MLYTHGETNGCIAYLSDCFDKRFLYVLLIDVLFLALTIAGSIVMAGIVKQNMLFAGESMEAIQEMQNPATNPNVKYYVGSSGSSEIVGFGFKGDAWGKQNCFVDVPETISGSWSGCDDVTIKFTFKSKA